MHRFGVQRNRWLSCINAMRYNTDTNFAQSTGADKTQISPERGDSSTRRPDHRALNERELTIRKVASTWREL